MKEIDLIKELKKAGKKIKFYSDYQVTGTSLFILEDKINEMILVINELYDNRK